MPSQQPSDARWRILCVDFDGVIHDYKDGWQGGAIYGDVTPGFWEWAKRTNKWFRLVVYSSRSKDPDLLAAMMRWVSRHADKHGLGDITRSGEASDTLRFFDPKDGESLTLYFAHEKPSAFLTIDDRAICFKGDWDAPELNPKMMAEFKPWMQQP